MLSILEAKKQYSYAIDVKVTCSHCHGQWLKLLSQIVRECRISGEWIQAASIRLLLSQARTKLG